MDKDTTLWLYVQKNGEKASAKQMNKSKGKKINCPMYDYKINVPSEPFNSSDVTLTLKDSVYKNENDSLAATWKNASKHILSFGEMFVVEKHENNSWTELKYQPENIAFPLIAHVIPGGGAFERSYGISSCYGKLEAGKYRIKDAYVVESEIIQNPNGSHKIKEHVIYAEFTVEQ